MNRHDKDALRFALVCVAGLAIAYSLAAAITFAVI